MNSLVGKSTGIALLMAAALLAALFSMGVFSASGVSAEVKEGATVSVSNSLPAATGVTMTVTFQVDEAVADNAGGITVTLPTGFTFGGDSEQSATQDGKDVRNVTQQDQTVTIEFEADASGANDDEVNAAADEDIVLTITDLTNPDQAELEADPQDAAVVGPVTIVQAVADGGTEVPREVAHGVSLGGGSVKLSSTTAGKPVQVVVNAWAESPKTSATDITVNLAKFDVPSTIAERSIIIEDVDESTAQDGADGAQYIGEPGSIVVSGTKVTLSLYARFPGASDIAGTLDDQYRITFKQSAGISNPATAGTATVTVSDGDDNNHALKETIQSVVTLSKGSAARGTDVTVTGVGLGAGGATVFLVQGACADQGTDADGEDCTEDNDISLGTGTTEGGKVEIDIETSSDDFIANVEPVDEDGNVKKEGPYSATDSLRGLNRITIVDGTGRVADKMARFTVTPTIDVEEDAIQQGDELTIIVEDWYYSGVSSVTIGDETAQIEDYGSNAGDFEVDIIVPPSARLGEQELKVTGGSKDKEGSLAAGKNDVAKGTVVIGALSIDVEPSSFVLGQQFTINVKGFSTDDPPANVDGTAKDESDEIQLVKVGNHPLEETTGGVEIDELSIDTNGFFTNTFRLEFQGPVPEAWQLPGPGGRPLRSCGLGPDNHPRTHHHRFSGS